MKLFGEVWEATLSLSQQRDLWPPPPNWLRRGDYAARTAAADPAAPEFHEPVWRTAQGPGRIAAHNSLLYEGSCLKQNATEHSSASAMGGGISKMAKQ